MITPHEAERIREQLLSVLQEDIRNTEHIRYTMLKGLGRRAAPLRLSEISFLLDRLIHGSFSERSWSSGVLRKVTRRQDVREAMIKLVEDPEPGLRSSAIDYLSAQTDPESRALLAQVARGDPNDGNRKKAASALTE